MNYKIFIFFLSNILIGDAFCQTYKVTFDMEKYEYECYACHKKDIYYLTPEKENNVSLKISPDYDLNGIKPKQFIMFFFREYETDFEQKMGVVKIEFRLPRVRKGCSQNMNSDYHDINERQKPVLVELTVTVDLDDLNKIKAKIDEFNDYERKLIENERRNKEIQRQREMAYYEEQKRIQLYQKQRDSILIECNNVILGRDTSLTYSQELQKKLTSIYLVGKLDAHGWADHMGSIAWYSLLSNQLDTAKRYLDLQKYWIEEQYKLEQFTELKRKMVPIGNNGFMNEDWVREPNSSFQCTIDNYNLNYLHWQLLSDNNLVQNKKKFKKLYIKFSRTKLCDKYASSVIIEDFKIFNNSPELQNKVKSIEYVTFFDKIVEELNKN